MGFHLAVQLALNDDVTGQFDRAIRPKISGRARGRGLLITTSSGVGLRADGYDGIGPSAGTK